jgi:hypothetical protein
MKESVKIWSRRLVPAVNALCVAMFALWLVMPKGTWWASAGFDLALAWLLLGIGYFGFDGEGWKQSGPGRNN